VWLLTASDHTGLHRAYGPENDWLFHFDDELKGVRRANYPQLTKEMNPNRRSWYQTLYLKNGKSLCQSYCEYEVIYVICQIVISNDHEWLKPWFQCDSTFQRRLSQNWCISATWPICMPLLRPIAICHYQNTRSMTWFLRSAWPACHSLTMVVAFLKPWNLLLQPLMLGQSDLLAVHLLSPYKHARSRE